MPEKVGTCKASFHSMLRKALYLSRGMRFPTFDILTSVDSDEPLQPLNLETPNGVQSVV